MRVFNAMLPCFWLASQLPCCPIFLQANWLRSQGVGKGDTVSIYMPMICELPIAMVRGDLILHAI